MPPFFLAICFRIFSNVFAILKCDEFGVNAVYSQFSPEFGVWEIFCHSGFGRWGRADKVAYQRYSVDFKVLKYRQGGQTRQDTREYLGIQYLGHGAYP